MAVPYMTGDTLITSVKRKALLPTSQATFTDDDFLAFANEEMALGLVPSIMSAKEDYFLFTQEIPIVANQFRYELPSRAVGNKLRDLVYKDPNGNIYEMSRLPIDDAPFYNGPNTSWQIYTYYIDNNEFVLLPSMIGTAQGSFVMTYYIRPNQIVKSERVGIVTSVDLTTGIINLDKAPTDFSVTLTFDIVQEKSPHKCTAIDLVPTSYSALSNQISFDPSTLPATLKKGDRICLAYESDIPQVPSDLHVILAHRTSARCLEALGDLEGLQASNSKLGEYESKMQDLIDDRVESSPKKIVNRHASLRQGLNSRRFRFRS